MQSKEIRKQFIEFFEAKGHRYVPSAPMVLKNDPTLMFTNAGMNQFKDLFLGNSTADYTRAVNSQKCLRVSGKHNDLEEVGIDTYHHTMFEMLGNWSFGDYFKKETISWAWEVLTDVFKLPKEKLYVTVFEGDKADGLAFDQEAYDFWKELIAEERILNGDKKDNFWEMGETGPCGPCSEIHIDLRSAEEIAKVPGKDLVNQDHPQVVEIWNLVFMQYDRKANGSLENLPAQHIDTGMGFERLAMALQGKLSNYDTDVFTPLIQKIEKASGIAYKNAEETDIAIRVIVDHVRAIAFAIADGQLPSNNKAGYVIRRILRRAVRYGYTFLRFKEPFIYQLVEVLASQYEGFFDELVSQKDFIAKVIKEEENAFLRTLDKGMARLQEEFDKPEIKNALEGLNKNTEAIENSLQQVSELVGDNVKNFNPSVLKIDGSVVFEMYDTFGFPADLTELIAREKGIQVDHKGFMIAMEQQKQRSKADAASEKGDWIILNDDISDFVGYDNTSTKAKILKYREVSDKKGKLYQIVLDKTPFYGESGGQIGDQGVLEADGEEVFIYDTQKENDLIVHFAKKLPANVEAEFTARVNQERRELIMNNHSATHLLHAALREVLGDHVQQKGSLVSDEVLRFDFSHFQKVTDEELERIELIVDQRIRQNIQLNEQRNVPIDQAKEMGATALFGEKYGDFVRVITFDRDYSVELCGGTHVPATGVIGTFKIVSEAAVAAGVRRIEAITGPKAYAYVQEQERTLAGVKALLKNPKDLEKAVQSLLDEQKKLTKEIEGLHAKQAGQVKDDLIKMLEQKGATNILIQRVKLPNADALKKLAFELKNEVSQLFAVLAADIDGKPQIAVIIDDELVKSKDLNAGNIVRDLAKNIKGGGGGQPFFATAGGKDITGLDQVVAQAQGLVDSL